MPRGRVLGHLPAAAFFAALGIFLTWPLAQRLATHVPGTGPDDNMMFLWDFWWMREAIATGSSFFHTDRIFFPFGADLALHTHFGLNALIGATLLSSASVLTALNLTTILSSALNGFTAYLLVCDVTQSRRAGLVGGVCLASSAVLAAHVFGHFNYYCVWPLILFVLLSVRFRDRPTIDRAICAGAGLALVAYADYYYSIYALVFVVCLFFDTAFETACHLSPPRRPGRIDVVLLALLAAAIALAGWIAVTGGMAVSISGHRVSLTEGRNLRALALLLVIALAFRRRRPRWSWRLRPLRLREGITAVAAGIVTTGIFTAPLWLAAWRLVRRGGYVTQHYFWRSSPPGIDPAGLLLGNPFNWLGGAVISNLYRSLTMSAFDGPAWLGVAAIVILWQRRAWASQASSGLWKLVGVVFFVWALGPRLSAFGQDMGLPLPAMLLHVVPIVSNVRIPGHAMIMVSLSTAVILGITVAARPRWQSAGAIAILVGVLLLDGYSAPITLYAVERPAIYETLRALPAGGVLELPLGIRDGFGEQGHLDPATLFYQSIHRKPIVSGYIARLPDTLRARFQESPALRTLLALSSDPPNQDHLTTATDAGAELWTLGIRYIVVNNHLASPALREYVRSMPTQTIADNADRMLLVVSARRLGAEQTPK